MKNTLLRYVTFSVLSLSLIVGSTGPALATATTTPGETEECHMITLTSDTATQTAGYTETTQAGPTTALLPASYSNTVFGPATLTQTVIPPWVDPTVNGDFIGSGAEWISTHATWPGGVDNAEGTANADQWRLFQDSFTLPGGAVVNSAMVHFATDNAADVYLNGNTTPIATTNDVYGTPADTSAQNHANVFTSSFSPTAGANTLDFVLRNWGGGESATNPTGLLYKVVVEYCVPTTPSETVTVTIDKYIDGTHATALNADSKSFPMSSTWDADNIGSGTGSYTLDTPNSYQAMTVEMTSGADYATHEVLGGDVVGESCTTEQPFALAGYTYGNTYEEAQAATPSMTSPSFTDITSDKYVIVWNHDCASESGTIGGDVTGGSPPEGTLAVTSITAVDTNGTADNTYENGWSYVFNITVPTNEQNLSMKFSDWTSPAPGTILAGGNMRISSAQADNGGATVPITAANTYSVPPLHMTGDLNLAMAGLQVQVLVEVKIPIASVNGSYTTTYGVQTLP